jgi:hypothetical protein
MKVQRLNVRGVEVSFASALRYSPALPKASSGRKDLSRVRSPESRFSFLFFAKGEKKNGGSNRGEPAEGSLNRSNPPRTVPVDPVVAAERWARGSRSLNRLGPEIRFGNGRPN